MISKSSGFNKYSCYHCNYYFAIVIYNFCQNFKNHRANFPTCGSSKRSAPDLSLELIFRTRRNGKDTGTTALPVQILY
jgi:hypothetical protein